MMRHLDQEQQISVQTWTETAKHMSTVWLSGSNGDPFPEPLETFVDEASVSNSVTWKQESAENDHTTFLSSKSSNELLVDVKEQRPLEDSSNKQRRKVEAEVPVHDVEVRFAREKFFGKWLKLNVFKISLAENAPLAR